MLVFSLHTSILSFLSRDQYLYIAEQYVYIYIHISDCVDTVYALPLLPNNTAVKHFYTNQSGVKCSLDMYHCGADLAVTGPIHDTGRNVLQSSLQTGSSISPSYCHMFFLISFLEEALLEIYY